METTHLQNYLHQFTHLRTDTNHHYWSPKTHFRAPHKPFLLLSILDLFAQGALQTNFIEITPELGELFSKYWRLLMPLDRHGNMALPFFHLRSSSFWHLIPVSGKEALLEGIKQVDTLSQLQKLILGAKLDDELFQLLQVEEARNVLRMKLIQTYFDPEYHVALLQQGSVHLQSYLYSQELLQKTEKQIKETAAEETEYQTNIRDQGFRRAIVKIYDHRCAFCGVRMLTVDGHSVVDAAHIIPWATSHNDDPRNGMALCRLCHWTFDEGLTGVSTKYTLLLSAELRASPNLPGNLTTLESRPIWSPQDPAFMPAPESLGWHREKVFRK